MVVTVRLVGFSNSESHSLASFFYVSMWPCGGSHLLVGRLFLDATTHLYKRSCPSVRPLVPRYFQTTKNVISYAPMTMKFDMDQETVKDNS